MTSSILHHLKHVTSPADNRIEKYTGHYGKVKYLKQLTAHMKNHEPSQKQRNILRKKIPYCSSVFVGLCHLSFFTPVWNWSQKLLDMPGIRLQLLSLADVVLQVAVPAPQDKVLHKCPIFSLISIFNALYNGKAVIELL